jgi:hypothetical protein
VGLVAHPVVTSYQVWRRRARRIRMILLYSVLYMLMIIPRANQSPLFATRHTGGRRQQ